MATTPDGPAPPWLEEERKKNADEIAQLKAKILSSRQQEKDVQRALNAKHARCEEERDAALAELKALKLSSSTTTTASASSAGGASSTGIEEDGGSGGSPAVASAVKAAVERERDLNAVQTRTLQKELETRTAEGLAKMASMQKELEAQRSRVAQIAAEKAAANSEKARLTLLVEQLRKSESSSDASSSLSVSLSSTAASSSLSSGGHVSIASRMASTAHDAQALASELKAENDRLRQQLESAQNAMLRDRSRAEEVERAAAAATTAREELAMARRQANDAAAATAAASGGDSLTETTPPPLLQRQMTEVDKQLNLQKAAAASEAAMLRQEIARLKKAAETASTTTAKEKQEDTAVRRALEARVRDAEAELAREKERRAHAERRAEFAEVRANTAAEGIGISSEVAGGAGGAGDEPPRASVALMTATSVTQGELVKEVAILRDRLATQEAGLELERQTTVAQIKALTVKNAELSTQLSEEKKKKTGLFGGIIF